MKPVDMPLRALWAAAKKLGYGEKLTSSITENFFPFMRAFFRTVYNIKLTGIENLPVGKRAIITPNHGSWLDAQLLGPFLLEDTYFLAKKELLTFPVMGIFMEMLNAVSIDRDYVDIKGLNYIADNPGKNFYAEEELGGVKYFTAVYPDVGVAPACVSCHNKHKDSPRTDFKLGEVMGGVVIRIPL